MRPPPLWTSAQNSSMSSLHGESARTPAGAGAGAATAGAATAGAATAGAATAGAAAPADAILVRRSSAHEPMRVVGADVRLHGGDRHVPGDAGPERPHRRRAAEGVSQLDVGRDAVAHQPPDAEVGAAVGLAIRES